jgi:DNA-directed RNA polymerase subunit RPC12/RpoP
VVNKGRARYACRKWAWIKVGTHSVPYAIMRHDDENGDESDAIDDELDDTFECPHCRRAIYDDAVQCPYCGNYLSAEDSPRQPRPWWIVIGFVLALLAALLLLLP